MDIRRQLEMEQRTLRMESEAKRQYAIDNLIKEDAKLRALHAEMYTLLEESIKTGESDALHRHLEKFEKALAKKAPQLDEDVYRCPLCEDRGWTKDGEMCSCFKKKLVERYFSQGEQHLMLASQNFETFDASIFSKEVMHGEERSARENIEKNRDVALKYVETFDPTSSPSLIFVGKTGTGKTFLTSAIVKALLERGFSVLYCTAIGIADIYQEKQFGAQKDHADVEEKIELLKSVDLLVIDDLGTELDTQLTRLAMFDILNARTECDKPVLINTNLAPHELSARYEDRIFSRMCAKGHVLEFVGQDIRWEARKC